MRDSLLAYMIQKAGFRKARYVGSFLVEWAVARDALKLETMTVAQYAEFWHVPERTGYHQQKVFREVLGAEWTPDQVVDLMMATRKKNPSGLRWNTAS